LKSTVSSIGKLLWAQLAIASVVALFFRGNPSFANYAALIFLVAVAFREKFSIFEHLKVPSFRSFWQTMLLIFGLQLISQGLYWVFEAILKPMGLHQDITLYQEYLGSGWSLFLLSVIIAPLAEELLFRGFLLRRLQPYGAGFALLVTSMIFALQHGILTQVVYTFFMGIILGVVALRFGLRWSILLHALNNFLAFLQISLQHLGHGTQDNVSEPILLLSKAVNWLDIALGVGAILYFGWMIWQKRGELKAFWNEHKPEKGLWWELLTNGWMISFLTINVMTILFMLIAPNLPGLSAHP